MSINRILDIAIDNTKLLIGHEQQLTHESIVRRVKSYMEDIKYLERRKAELDKEPRREQYIDKLIE